MRYTPDDHDALARDFNRNSRGWLHRPEVNIRIPRSSWDDLSPQARKLLRLNPVVSDDQLLEATESYRVFAY